MVVHAGAEERELVPDRHVARRQLTQVRHELGLRERRLEVELAPEPNAGGDVAEEVVDARDSDDGEHLLPVVVRQGEEGV